MVRLAGLRVVRAMPVPFSQAAAVSLIKNQYPTVNFHGMRWPVLEDFINQPVFINFHDWVHEHGFAADGVLGPTVLPSLGVAAFGAGMAEQSGAAGRRLALPPVVPFSLDPEQHFHTALQVQLYGCPLDFPAPVERDLTFASCVMAENHENLFSLRQAGLEVLKGVAEGLSPISEAIRRQQAESLQQVNPAVQFALLALLVGLLQWPDTTFFIFFHCLFAGFPADGYLPPCGIWAARPATYLSLADTLTSGVEDAHNLLAELRHRALPSEDLEVIHPAGEVGEQNHWCTPESGWDEVLRTAPLDLSSRDHPSLRKEAGAASGGQSLYSQDSNKLQFCSALQPCAHVSTL